MTQLEETKSMRTLGEQTALILRSPAADNESVIKDSGKMIGRNYVKIINRMTFSKIVYFKI